MRRQGFAILLSLLLCVGLAVGQFDDDEPEDVIEKIIRDREINENYVLLKNIKKPNITENYRLPKSIIPESYKITLNGLLIQSFNFTGIVEINATVADSTNEISLHYKNLTIVRSRVFLANYTEVQITGDKYNNVTSIYTLKLAEYLEVESTVLITIEYNGVLSEESNGLYRSSYYDSTGKRRWLATTQFEPVYARKAFPCFDEPGFKARFQLGVERPKNYTALSNMPVVETINFSDSALDIFAETPRMSSYILALVISDFSSLSTNGSKVQIWSKNDIIKDGHFALHFGTKVLNGFGDLFNMSNPVPKTDMIAVPDFASGAMENWGLITYREHLLIYEEEENTDALQQSVGGTIAHELAHMWFGNLLSPQWWEFTWLNEGFANYFQHIGTHLAEPSWKMAGRYLIDIVRAALYYDSSKYSVSISHPCSTPVEISDMFGVITYQKGGSVIRMMKESFGEEVFYSSLKVYIAKHKFGNVKSDDLWEVMQSQMDKLNPDLKVPVKELMSKWINEPGHPVLQVKVTQNQIHLSQKRFLLESEPGNDTWYIPITYATEKSPNFTSAVTNVWMKEDMVIDVVNASKQWVIFNVLGAGFYRVNYDRRSWYRIIKTLNSKNYGDIHEYNRVVIIDDLFHLARAGYLEYDVVLDALQYIPHESNYLTIKMALNGLQFMSNRFSGHEDEELLNNHIIHLIKDIYKRHGYFDGQSDSKYDILLRSELNSVACKLNYSKCMSNAVKLFAKWRKDPTKKVPKNQRYTTYCYALQEGSVEDWEFLHAQYNNTVNVHERLTILKSLGCTRNHALLEKYLFKAMTNYDSEHQIHKQDSLSLFQTVASNGFEGAKYMLQFLAKYHDKVVTHYKDNSTVVQLLLTASRSFTTQERIDQFQEYITENSNKFKQILPYLENIKQNAIHQLQWYNKHSTTIINWLYKMYPIV